MKQRYKLLIVDDEVSFARVLQRELEESGDYAIDLAFDGADAINWAQKTLYDLVLLDIRLPRVDGTEVLKFLRENFPSTPVIIVTGNTDISIAIRSMKMGAYDYIGKPYDIDELQSTVERALENKKLKIGHALMKRELLRKTGRLEPPVGQSRTFLDAIDRAKKVASSDSNVLIQGASGTGKELIARLIHDHSPRCKNPFVTVDCASIPDTLLESELFGYQKGAFTGAYETKHGLVEEASGGTLFLDEVGDVGPPLQPKLLRFLETRQFRRVGNVEPFEVDVRILSATNKDLQSEVSAGRFREDLLYRLNVVTLHMPPLRDRKDDIPLLVDHFLKLKSKTKTSKTIDPAAMDVLLAYGWPGNVRELEHVLEGAIIMSQGDSIGPLDLLLPARQETHSAGTNGIIPIEELEKRHIEAALRHFNGNRTKTAQSLKISQKTLYLKIKRYGIKVR